MKEYVIDDRRPEAAATSNPDPSPSAFGPDSLPPWLRPLLLLAALEAMAFATFWLASSPAPRSGVVAGNEIAYVAAFDAAAPQTAARTGPPGGAAPADAAGGTDKIARTRGGYSIQLHSANPIKVLEMLSEATTATVRGGEVLDPQQAITRTLVAKSPLEAWRAIFGDVANFAVTCSANACAVRFASTGKPIAADTATGVTPETYNARVGPEPTREGEASFGDEAKAAAQPGS